MWLERWLRKLGPASSELHPVDASARLATYPPPYPTGWYALCEADTLRAGEVRFIEALGRKLVLFRGEGGKLAALDAYCPHLGANLAGGKVRGDCIECPFHRWTFGGDGHVERVPYLDRVPGKLGTQAWAVREHHGMVVMWFSADEAEPHERESTRRRGLREPDWELAAIDAIDSGEMVYRGHHDAGVVHMHLCEFAENSADHRHFAPLHGDMFLPWTNIKLPWLGVRHEASWERDPDQPHIAYFHDDAVLTAGGKPIANSGAHATITFYGPGSIVAFRFEREDVGSLLMFQTHLPVGPLSQHVRFRWFAETKMPRALVSYVVGNWVSQWRQDISIWENKIFRSKPMLVQGDGPIHPMRRWYQQFYETSGPTNAQ